MGCNVLNSMWGGGADPPFGNVTLVWTRGGEEGGEEGRSVCKQNWAKPSLLCSFFTWPKAKAIQQCIKPVPSVTTLILFSESDHPALWVQKTQYAATPTTHSRARTSIQGFVWTVNKLVSKYNLVASTQIWLKTMNKDQTEACDFTYHLRQTSCWLKAEEIRASSSIEGQIKITGELKQGREMFTSQKMRNLVWREHMLC